MKLKQVNGSPQGGPPPIVAVLQAHVQHVVTVAQAMSHFGTHPLESVVFMVRDLLRVASAPPPIDTPLTPELERIQSACKDALEVLTARLSSPIVQPPPGFNPKRA